MTSINKNPNIKKVIDEINTSINNDSKLKYVNNFLKRYTNRILVNTQKKHETKIMINKITKDLVNIRKVPMNTDNEYNNSKLDIPNITFSLDFKYSIDDKEKIIQDIKQQSYEKILSSAIEHKTRNIIKLEEINFYTEFISELNDLKVENSGNSFGNKLEELMNDSTLCQQIQDVFQQLSLTIETILISEDANIARKKALKEVSLNHINISFKKIFQILLTFFNNNNLEYRAKRRKSCTNCDTNSSSFDRYRSLKKENTLKETSKVIFFNNPFNISIPNHIKEILELGCKFMFKTNINTYNLGNLKKNLLQKELNQLLHKNPKEDLALALKYLEITPISNLLNQEDFDKSFKILKRFNDLKMFLNKNNLFIIQSDKNLGLTVVTKKCFYEQLNNKIIFNKSIIKSNINIDNIIKDLEIISTVENFKYIKYYKNLIKYFISNIKNTKFTIPQPYILLKIHKPTIGSRLIIPSFNWITYNVSNFLSKELNKIIPKYSFIIKNSTDFINKVENFSSSNKLLLYSIDIVDWYNSIDMEFGLNANKTILYEHFSNNKRYADFLLKLLEWVLCNNYVELDSIIYKQVKGTAMGTPVAPPYAIITSIYIEKLTKKKICTNKFLNINYIFNNYKRYMDDSFGIARNLSNAKLFLQSLKSNYKDLDYSIESNIDEINFLDLTIFWWYNQQSKKFELKVKPFYKPINKYLYTDPTSYYPDNYKFSWIQGEHIRIIRNSSFKKHYKEAKLKLIENLKKRNYPKKIIHKFLSKNKYTERKTLLNNITNKKVISSNITFEQIPNNKQFNNLNNITKNILVNLNLKDKIKSDKKVIYTTDKGSSLNDKIKKINIDNTFENLSTTDTHNPCTSEDLYELF